MVSVKAKGPQGILMDLYILAILKLEILKAKEL